jgi:hypothetical protein
MNSAAFLKYQDYSIDKKYETVLFNSEVIQWAFALALPVVGLLMLCFFLSLGGAFALLGPFAICIAARIITCNWDKRVCKIETFETQRGNITKLIY